MDRWTGRVAIVTGASAGIGSGIVRALVQNGMKVVGVARREDRIQVIANELKKEGAKGELHAIKCDITKEDDIKRVVKWTRDNLGGADVLVNNAGVAPNTTLTGFPTEKFRATYDTNVLALAILTREVFQDMQSRGVDDGHIFHINSLCGQVILQYPGMYAYSGSKHAVTVMAEGLRRELRDLKTKIRVTSISPGLVQSEIALANGLPAEAVKKFYENNVCLQPKDVADALVYALGTPPHVQVHEITIRPTGEKL